MDGEKSKVHVMGRRRFPFQGCSLLVLTLLLTVCVGALVYLSLDNQLCQWQQVSETVDVEADVTVKSDNQEKGEKITYNRDYRVAYYSGADGSFEVDDFGKGIHIIRAPKNKVCYVIPVGTDPISDQGFEDLLMNSNRGGQINVNQSSEVNVEILPGQIEDISFIPQGAQSECTNGYRWMVVSQSDANGYRVKRQVTNGNDTETDEDIEDKDSGEVDKDDDMIAPPCRYCYVFYVVNQGLYEACFSIVGFEFCHALYKDGERPQWVLDLIDG